MKRAIFICFGSPKRNSRIVRAAHAASKFGWDVSAIGFSGLSIAPPIIQTSVWSHSNIYQTQVNPMGFASKVRTGILGVLGIVVPAANVRRALSYYLPNIASLTRFGCDILDEMNEKQSLSNKDMIFVEHWQGYFIAFYAQQKYNCQIIYDLAELSSVEFSYKLLWKYLVPNLIKSVETPLVLSADKITSVLPSPDLYFKNELNQKVETVFVPNQPNQENKIYTEDKDVLRSRKNQVVYVGGVRPKRGLETMIKALRHLPDNILFMCQGYGQNVYHEALYELAEHEGVSERFSIIPAVPVEDLVASLQGYLLGLCVLDSQFDQLRLSQPNKAFLYLAAKLPMVVETDSLLAYQMSKLPLVLTVQYDDPQALAKAILETQVKVNIKQIDIDAYLKLIDAKEFDALFID